MRPVRLLLVALVLALVLAAGCALPRATPTPGPFATVTDSQGITVVLHAAAKRIVSLGPSNTEILYALGTDNRVVGVDDYSDYPSEA